MPSVDLLKLINTLLPGFLTAWIFYGLTAHPRKDMFERTIQALVFPGIVQAIVYPFRRFANLLHSRIPISFGTWTDETTLAWSIVVAIGIGVLFAGWANNGTIHNWLHGRGRLLLTKRGDDRWAWTKRTSYPSEWFSAFNENQRYVTLHFKDKDKQRLYGWPYEWPDQAETGHFVLMEPCWLDEDNNRIELKATFHMLVPASAVEFVEFMKESEEL